MPANFETKSLSKAANPLIIEPFFEEKSKQQFIYEFSGQEMYLAAMIACARVSVSTSPLKIEVLNKADILSEIVEKYPDMGEDDNKYFEIYFKALEDTIKESTDVALMFLNKLNNFPGSEQGDEKMKVDKFQRFTHLKVADGGVELEGSEKYLATSSLRAQSLNPQKKASFSIFLANYIKEALIDSFTKSLVQEISPSANVAQMRSSFSKGDSTVSSRFLRDGLVVISGSEKSFHSPDPKKIPEFKNNIESAKRITSANADIAKTLPNPSSLPVYIEGGNLIDVPSKNLVIIQPLQQQVLKAVHLSMRKYSGKPNSLTPKALEKAVRDSIKDSLGIDEEEDMKTIKEWFKKEFPEKDLIFVRFDFGKIAKIEDFLSLYHLDLSCGTVGDNVVFARGIFDQDSELNLMTKFGSKKTIIISEEERLAKCTNFISVGNTVILTKDCDASRSFAEKLAEKKFNVVIPGLMLA